jgi:hypothetical protein
MDLNKNVRNRRNRGMATIETALALPTVFLVFVALVDFSVAFQEFLAANHAAEVGVRSASLSLGNGCNTGLVQDAGRDAAAQALVQAGVIETTDVGSFSGGIVVRNLDSGNRCDAGLLEIDIPMTLRLPYLQSLIAPVALDAFSQPVAYRVKAVAQNENRQ